MPFKTFPKRFFLLCVIVVLFLIAAQCGSTPEAAEPPPEPTPTVTEATQTTEQESSEQETGSQTDAQEDASQETVKEVVEQSEAAQAEELSGGATVVTDEEVASVRENYGGEYHGITTSDAVSFHPYLTVDTTSSSYQGLIYTGGLLRLDENTLEYIPNMAESYTISEDGLTFTFELRENMLWSDGTPITAHDFKWTYDQIVNPDNGFPYLAQLAFITSYEALDDYTIEAKIDEIYAPALGQISGMISPLPKHIWENLDWSDPETNPEINSPSVVSGPYKLSEWKRDEYIIFEANDNYWYHGRPNIERSITEIVPDQDIAYQKFKSGETDNGPITPENLDEARQLDNINLYEWWPAAARWSFVGLNQRQGFPTSDINVRHGINYAIDKKLLTDEIMLGQGKRLCSVFPDTSWVYNPDVPCYDYDVDQALAEFEEAGYTFDGEKLVDEDGEQLSLRLVYGPNTSQTLELTAISVQDYLSQIGIDVEVQALEWSSFLETIQSDAPDWDLYLGAWRATIEPQIMFSIWAEENIPQLNAVAYVNKEVEALFDEAGGTYDTEFRKEKYQEIQQIIAEDAPYVFLFYNKTWGGLNKRVQGIEPTPLGIQWNREDWFIEQDIVE